MIQGGPRVEALGDRGVLIKFKAPPSRALTQKLMGISAAAARLPGVVDAAPGLTSVLIELAEADPTFVDGLLPRLMDPAHRMAGVLHQVPIEYNGEDFEWALSQLDLSAEAFIGLHGSRTYDVRLLGSPGFIYLSNVDAQLSLPRLENPRQQVAAGSVGIAGTQAGIYGRSRPGGWRIVATTRAVPRVRPGDRVQFVSS